MVSITFNYIILILRFISTRQRTQRYNISNLKYVQAHEPEASTFWIILPVVPVFNSLAKNQKSCFCENPKGISAML